MEVTMTDSCHPNVVMKRRFSSRRHLVPSAMNFNWVSWTRILDLEPYSHSLMIQGTGCSTRSNIWEPIGHPLNFLGPERWRVKLRHRRLLRSSDEDAMLWLRIHHLRHELGPLWMFLRIFPSWTVRIRIWVNIWYTYNFAYLLSTLFDR